LKQSASAEHATPACDALHVPGTPALDPAHEYPGDAQGAIKLMHGDPSVVVATWHVLALAPHPAPEHDLHASGTVFGAPPFGSLWTYTPHAGVAPGVQLLPMGTTHVPL
jgi:hypothetical protein